MKHKDGQMPPKFKCCKVCGSAELVSVDQTKCPGCGATYEVGGPASKCGCRVSTGICGCLTFGTGRLDSNGYFAKPCPHGSEVHDCGLSQPAVASPDRAEELAREIERIIAPAINPKSPYAKIMVKKIVEAALLRSRMSEPIGYWVSTDDRLPQPNSAVLFYTTYRCWESGYFRADEDEPVRWECERTNPQDERIDFFEGQVTHWVIPDPPLPSAPDTEEA